MVQQDIPTFIIRKVLIRDDNRVIVNEVLSDYIRGFLLAE